MAEYQSSPTADCAESVSGHHSPLDARGHCDWCGRKVGAAVSPPPPSRYEVSELEEAYQEHYNPDWGTAKTEYLR